jgi:TonB family protein
VFRLAPCSLGKPDGTTANERFKHTFWPTFAGTLSVAVVLHMAVFGFVPRFQITEIAQASEAMSAIDLPPAVEVPPPPERIARPATPRVSAVAVDEQLTIAPTTFEQNPVESLGPPPEVTVEEEDRPPFIPYTSAPKLLNREETLQLLRRFYPPSLRNAGVGGTVVLWIYVTEDGDVGDTQVATSSGYLLLDEAAQRVAQGMRFSPAMNRDRVTAVWLSQPILFEVV